MALIMCLLAAPAVQGATTVDLFLPTNVCSQESWPLFTPFPGTIQVRVTEGDVRVVNFAFEAVPAVVATYTPSAAVASATGNPFGEGASVLLQDCQPAGTWVKLYDVTLMRVSSQPVHFTIRPLNAMTCPTVAGCDLVASCVTFGGAATISEAPILTSPANGATDVPTNVELQWQSHLHALCTCASTPFGKVFFGTDPNPPLFGGVDYEVSTSHFDPGPLQPLTTYYWRIEDWNCVIGASSTLGTFRTQDLVAVRSNNWTTVKKLYR